MKPPRRILVTGASSGIGREVARLLAAKGHRLVLSARRVERLEELARELRGKGAETHVVPADLAAPSSQATLIRRCVELLGGLDVLVNNAGYGLPNLFSESDPAELRRQIEVNLTGPVILVREALGELIRNRGQVINVGSSMSFTAVPAFGVYGMTKAALAYWNDTLRRELRGRGVTVCLVEPGPIATEFLSVVETAGGLERESWLRRPPAFLNGTPEHAAARIVRLLDHPRRRISMLRRTVWPMRFVGGLLRVAPALGDWAFSPKKIGAGR